MVSRFSIDCNFLDNACYQIGCISKNVYKVTLKMFSPATAKLFVFLWENSLSLTMQYTDLLGWDFELKLSSSAENYQPLLAGTS